MYYVQFSAPAGGEPGSRNPLERTNIPFGGVINDIKYRYRHYWSDIKVGLYNNTKQKLVEKMS